MSTPEPTPRKRIKLFAGIALEQEVQRKVLAVAERLRERGVAARFESAQKYHITLAFLGWVEQDRIDDLAGALQAAADEQAPFELALDRLGAFPHERRPRVVWIGSRRAPRAYARLARALRSNYVALGFGFQGVSVAHVTIARMNAESALPTISAFAPIKTWVTSLALFESLPAGGTTRYEVRARAPL